jgi:hypothetical protein
MNETCTHRQTKPRGNVQFDMIAVSTSLPNLIGLDNPDIQIYRTFRLRHLRQLLREKRLTLVAPALWDDPFENLIVSCVVTFLKDGRYQQKPFDQVRRPLFAQCWSLAAESDALWRVYSTVIKDPASGRTMSVDNEGVKIRTTARKLLTALWQASPPPPQESCFLGLVVYMPESDATQTVANEVGRCGLGAFLGGLGHAKSLLIKREPFQHEREIRLVYVENRQGHGKSPLFSIPTEPNIIFDEAILDPRLHIEDAREREAELQSLGFKGRIAKSDLYQKKLFEIVIK